MSEPYLIAHVVRGQPAFDIAERCDDMGTESDPGPWWIIPTSGHRAYPYWSLPIHVNDITGNIYINQGMEVSVQFTVPLPPPNWPDHYSTTAAPRGTGLITNLAERLGLVKRPTITRR